MHTYIVLRAKTTHKTFRKNFEKETNFRELLKYSPLYKDVIASSLGPFALAFIKSLMILVR